MALKKTKCPLGANDIQIDKCKILGRGKFYQGNQNRRQREKVQGTQARSF